MILKQLGVVSFIMLCVTLVSGQSASIEGVIEHDEVGLDFATVVLKNTDHVTTTGTDGAFQLGNIPAGDYEMVISYIGMETITERVELAPGQVLRRSWEMKAASVVMDDIVVTGTMKEVSRLTSPVPVEVYSPRFFKMNPTPNIYEGIQTVNGVRPQLNCNVCNTGDIHINGLEGPYTMVLIDGMPIVSSLATVYGLSGIPNSLVERMEIVKGPASSLYGSEAIGGLINIITKDPVKAPKLSLDAFATSWQEYNIDLGLRFNLGNRVSVLTGANYYDYSEPIDNNNDNFTDVTLQDRLSVFQKWNFKRKDGRVFNLAGRYYWEERWGGEMDWTPAFRGGNEIYGESITTRRWEAIGNYQLPTNERMMISASFNYHDQNSVYGDVSYVADQRIGFGQWTWDKKIGRHDMIMGAAIRYTYYDDNTPATGGERSNPDNDPDEVWLPGIFIQDELTLSKDHSLLLGMRYDYDDRHGNIFTPRVAYKWSITDLDILRFNAGTGFRVVNLFTEDHAALTGAREVVIAEALEPEQSYNANLNYTRRFYFGEGSVINLEMSAWFTYFTNQILPDYESQPNQIIYDNLDGFSVSQGASLNLDMTLDNGITVMAGGTLMDVSTEEDGVRTRQILTERFTGTWGVSIPFAKGKWNADYTGNVYGPMRLPTLGDLDPRPDESPWWSIQNIQLTYKGFDNIEIYGGVKNLLDWTPWRDLDEPIIARAFDPFDRGVDFDSEGNPLPTPGNPNALTFDPTYVFGPNQGIRGFLGFRFNLL